ncbi:MFS transporter [Microbacterium sp. QXD-8]|uniref:MFS transporter n=1 Tax=Microbacterium psychrotolerans TaxID=3068321 RepID=A0ABU0YX43_9MICO|nr:MFS transporter [Microbacterium sp. QXD-8]MDQ7876895.1 MFS transporter [Microbacterium sp. QXD-8]
MDTVLTRTQLVAWRTAIFVVFFATGLGFATWAARVPSVKANLGINDFEVGLLLFASGAASILGLSLANVVLARWGARRGLLMGLATFAIGIVLVGFGADITASFALTATGLAVMGLGMGATDVMMNVEGAAIEQASGKTIMPLFHALFSLGTVAGAGVGVAMAAWQVGVAPHLWIVGCLVVVGGAVAVTFVPRREVNEDPTDAADTPSRREKFAAAIAVWRDPRTYAIGAIMLGMAFAEGGANDWLPLSVVDGHGGTEAQGAIALTVFSVAMTAVRALGGPLVDRFGRVWTLRILAILAGGGLVIFILAPSMPIALIGVALWGMGASLGFPLGMSAAADDPKKAAASVSAAATIGYVAFLCGPPILGWISHQIGLLPTLWILVALIALSGFASGAAKPIAGSQVGAGHHH